MNSRTWRGSAQRGAIAWRGVASAGVLALSSAAGGCAESAVIAAAGVTAGFGLAQGQAEAFIRGELQAARMVPMNEAYAAAEDALRELQLVIRTQRLDEHSAYVRAKAEGGGPEIKVTIKRISPVVCRYEIRVGFMGNLATSRLVLSRIDAQLGIMHPVIPAEQSPVVAPYVDER